MRKPLSGHTLVGFLIHTAVMVMVAFWGGGILTKAVNETILKISAPTEIKKEARLLLSPPTGLITKGNRISLQIIVYPGAVDINAVGATVRYPANLKVVNLSRAGSFCTLYPEEFVNHQSRTVRIGCGLPTPGLTASSGVVGTINFEAVRTGRALVELDLAASSVHANDGQGTDVLARVEGAVLDIAEPAPQVAEAAAPAPPKITVISSPTHPDQDRWYSENLAVFQWIKETGVTGYAGLLDQSPQSTPDPTVIERSNIREFSGLGDGVWYFHLRARNEAGLGPISHFKIQIDTSSPELNVQSSAIDIDEGESVTISFSGEGAEEFLVKVNNESFESAESPLTLSDLPRGWHDIYVRAQDRADNITERSLSVYVKSPNLLEQFSDWLRRFLFKR